MTKFDANAYASGLTVKDLNAAIAEGKITNKQALAVCEAKTSRANIRKGALARWTRVAEQLKANGSVDEKFAFTGKRADEPKAAKPKAKPQPKAAPAENDVIARANALLAKKILSKAEKAELASTIAAFVTR